MKLSYVFLIFIVIVAFIFRFYNIDTNPPGLYIDEVSIGNDAYSILKTGRDQYGNVMPLWFRSFGDYKMPGYIYAVACSMAVFGKNEFAIRFPSALAGVLTVILLYFFLMELVQLSALKDLEHPFVFPSVAAFLLAVSAWHIQFSRGGFEVNLALFFYMLGLTIFTYFLSRKKIYILITVFVALVASSYTYHAFRVLAPITIFAISVLTYFKFNFLRRDVLLSFIVSLLLFFPLFIFSTTTQGTERFSQTSAFVEYNAPNFIDKIGIYPLVILKDYLTFFSTHFLFNFGDGIGRHQIPAFGLIPRWEFVFLILGIFFLAKNFKKYPLFFGITCFLVLIAPIPASIARPSPHSLRALLMVIPLTIIIAYGISFVFQNIDSMKKKIILVVVIFIGTYEFAYYLHHYYEHYPKVNSRDWGASYKDLVLSARSYQKQYPYIVVDKNLDFAPSYFLFYDPTIKPAMVDVTWTKPKSWGEKKILLIRPFYGPNDSKQILYQVKLPLTNDVFAEFWEL